MTVAEDASTPAVVHSALSTTGTTVTTAAFSPPSGSLLVVSAQVMNASAVWTGTPTISISSSNSLTFTQLIFARETNASFSYAGFWCAYLPSGATNMTVTMTRSQNAAGDMQFAVRVVTGAASTQSGATATADTASSTTTGQVSITPAALGSQMYVQAAPDNGGIGTATPLSGTTTIDDWDDSAGLMHFDVGKSTALTSSTTARTLGWTWSGPNASVTNAVEILAAASGATRQRHYASRARYRATLI